MGPVLSTVLPGPFQWPHVVDLGFVYVVFFAVVWTKEFSVVADLGDQVLPGVLAVVVEICPSAKVFQPSYCSPKAGKVRMKDNAVRMKNFTVVFMIVFPLNVVF
jgi:hypothetical protein